MFRENSYQMTWSWGTQLVLAEIVWVAAISALIMLERRPPTATLAWVTMLAET